MTRITVRVGDPVVNIAQSFRYYHLRLTTPSGGPIRGAARHRPCCGSIVRWLRGPQRIEATTGRRCAAMAARIGITAEIRAPPLPLSVFLCSLPFHDRDIAVGLISYHFPASGKPCQNRSLGSALRQQHEAMTFLSPNSATTCFVHFPSRIKEGHRRCQICQLKNDQTERAAVQWQ